MRWIKNGLLFNADHKFDWATNSALQPTPLQMTDTTTRVYCGFRDDSGVSRVGFVDVQAHEGTLSVAGVSPRPALDVGLPGAFDDNGVVPTAVVQRGHQIYLYYAGYQVGLHVRFLAFCGLAVSDDGGTTFVRHSHVPVLDRTNDEYLFRVIHSIVYSGGRWLVWYGGGSIFRAQGAGTVPEYDIRHMTSPDGLEFPDRGEIAIGVGDDEYRVGRPYVVVRDGRFVMLFGASTSRAKFRLAYATSVDGRKWMRQPDFGLTYEQDEFDSEMSAYPALIESGDTTYLLYNGNQYGRQGFGYATLVGDI